MHFNSVCSGVMYSFQSTSYVTIIDQFFFEYLLLILTFLLVQIQGPFTHNFGDNNNYLIIFIVKLLLNTIINIYEYEAPC